MFKTVKETTTKLLNDMEVKGSMARRDKIVAIYEDLIIKGNDRAIFYD